MPRVQAGSSRRRGEEAVLGFSTGALAVKREGPGEAGRLGELNILISWEATLDAKELQCLATGEGGGGTGGILRLRGNVCGLLEGARQFSGG